MAIQQTILGILLEKPSHGYEIKKYFAGDLSQDFGINDGHIYPALRRLQSEGLIEKRVVRQEKSPDKHIYSITEEGRGEFFAWLLGHDDEDDPVRYDFFWKFGFLIKCNFFGRLSPEEIEEKLNDQLELTRKKVLDFERIRERMQQRSADPYRVRIMEFGLGYQRLKEEWLENLRKEVHERHASRNSADKEKSRVSISR